MEMKIYLTNLGKYNEGELVGKWFTLPIDIEEALEEIGVADDTEYEEFFITDYENDFGLKIEEYSPLDKLNEIAEYVSDKDIDEIYRDIILYFGNDDEVYPMDELDDMLNGASPSDIANMIYFGKYNPNDDYFTFNGYGNIETLSSWDIEDIQKTTVADNIEQYIEENYY